MIFQVHALTAKETEVIGRIEELKSTLRYAVGEPRRWTGLLRRHTFARAIRGSNSIEGYNVSVDDAIAAAEGEEPLTATDESWAAVTGYRQAMSFVLQLADDPHFSYSEGFLRSLHYMMLQHDLSKSPGKWRPGPISVLDEEKGEVAYEAPDAERVPALMAELIAALNETESGQHGLVRAAMAHLTFVMIHPFRDGNGRMGRCLQTLVLARTGILAPIFSSIEEYLGRNTRAYYDVLAEVGGGHWSPERDTKPWIHFCLTAHFRQANTLLRRTRQMHRIWDALERTVAKAGIPERTVLALSDAATGLRVRNVTYRIAADISDQLASRDLKQLVDLGFLEPHHERRHRYYTAASTIVEFRNAAREPRIVEDPFEEQPQPTFPGLERSGTTTMAS